MSSGAASRERAEGSWGELLFGAHAARTATLAGGVALHAINIYVATTLLPSVVADIGGLPFYAWNLTLFVLGSIVGSALSARALATLGPRRVYALAIADFALGTLLCAVAPTMAVMLLGRAGQGLGGGMLLALSYALMQQVLPRPLWPRALALVSGIWGAATLIGPAVGGIFADLGVWRAAFWSLLLASAAFALLARRALATAPIPSPSAAPSVPLAQLIVLSGAALAVSAGSLADDPRLNLAGLAAAAALMAALLGLESRTAARLLPRGVFDVTTLLGVSYVVAALLGATTTAEIFVPYFMQVLHGLSPLAAGYVAALMAAGWACGSFATSGGGGGVARAAIAAGPLVVLVGVVGLALAMPRVGSDLAAVAAVCVGLALVGVGIGIAWPHLVTRVLAVAPADEQELAASAISTVQLLAEAFGGAVAGLIANRAGLTEPGGVVGASAAAAWLFRAFALLPLAAAVALLARALRGRGRPGPGSAADDAPPVARG